MGEVTPCLKYIALSSFYGVKTAWQGPADLNGAMANLHLSIFANNFEIQEWATRSDNEFDVFLGLVNAKSGKFIWMKVSTVWKSISMRNWL